MKITEQIQAKAVIRETARRNGVTPERCRRDIQECIDAAWNTTDPAAKARQQQLFPAGRKPTVEEFLIRVSRELNPTA